MKRHGRGARQPLMAVSEVRWLLAWSRRSRDTPRPESAEFGRCCCLLPDSDYTQLDPGSPRTLRLFLPQSTSPPSTSMEEEEIYEDAQSGDHLISDSDSEDDTTPRPSARVAEQLSDKEGAGPSFVELEFSYRGQRVVRSREEMTTRLRQAAATRSKRRR